MDQTLKIKVNIADRIYPLTVKREEEERIRKAVALVNDAVKRFGEKYAVQDKQDSLAMCALQLANQFLALKQSDSGANAQLEELLENLNSRLEAELG